MRIMLALILAITLAGPLAACGKQGPLTLPMTGLLENGMPKGMNA